MIKKLKNELSRLCLFGVIVCLLSVVTAATGFAADGTNGQKTTSWMGHIGSWVGLGADEKDGSADDSDVNPNSESGKNMATDFSDFLPDDFPGIGEYRLAMAHQRWDNRPLHKAQEVYDLFGVSATKGNVLARIRQYEMFLDNPDFTEGGDRFFSERLTKTCKQLYPIAVKGNADAQYLYARYCVDFKSAQAQSWFSRAFRQYRRFADQKVPYAQYMTGRIYQVLGEDKTAQDWFVIAAKNGNADAVCRIRPDVFHDSELWKNIPQTMKGNHSCAVYQALKLISQTNKDDVIAHTAMQLLLQFPVGYASKGFKDNGFYFCPVEKDEFWLTVNQHAQGMKKSRVTESAALAEKYKNNYAGFVDDSLRGFDWKKWIMPGK